MRGGRGGGEGKAERKKIRERGGDRKGMKSGGGERSGMMEAGGGGGREMWVRRVGVEGGWRGKGGYLGRGTRGGMGREGGRVWKSE